MTLLLDQKYYSLFNVLIYLYQSIDYYYCFLSCSLSTPNLMIHCRKGSYFLLQEVQLSFVIILLQPSTSRHLLRLGGLINFIMPVSRQLLQEKVLKCRFSFIIYEFVQFILVKLLLSLKITNLALPVLKYFHIHLNEVNFKIPLICFKLIK